MRLFALASLLGTALGLAGCGPDLGTPEAAARAIAEKELENLPQELEQHIERMKWNLDCQEKEMEWWADRGAVRNRIEDQRAELEFFEDNVGEIKDKAAFDVVDINKGPGDKGKVVTVSLWVYQPEELAKGSRMFYLKPDQDERQYHLVEKDGKWKRANKKG
jgi:hypothetical protein